MTIIMVAVLRWLSFDGYSGTRQTAIGGDGGEGACKIVVLEKDSNFWEGM